MSWVNSEGEVIILCNNNENSYYKDPIGSTDFIRKKYFDEYIENHTRKYFACSERFIPETGYAEETSPAEQYRLVIDCRQSGLSDARWCEENGIQSSTFYNWVTTLRKKGCEIPALANKEEFLP